MKITEATAAGWGDVNCISFNNSFSHDVTKFGKNTVLDNTAQVTEQKEVGAALLVLLFCLKSMLRYLKNEAGDTFNTS